MEPLSTLDFSSRIFASLVIIPQISPIFDGDLFKKVYELVPVQSINETSSISACIIYGSVMLSNPTFFDRAIFALCRLAESQPSLDTPEAVSQKLASIFNFPTLIDFCESGLQYVLDNWEIDLTDFPVFMYKQDTLEDFMAEYCDYYVHRAFNLLDFTAVESLDDQLPRLMVVRKSFGKIYAEYLLQIVKDQTTVIFFN